jgi:hypothetical protein
LPTWARRRTRTRRRQPPRRQRAHQRLPQHRWLSHHRKKSLLVSAALTVMWCVPRTHAQILDPLKLCERVHCGGRGCVCVCGGWLAQLQPPSHSCAPQCAQTWPVVDSGVAYAIDDRSMQDCTVNLKYASAQGMHGHVHVHCDDLVVT